MSETEEQFRAILEHAPVMIGSFNVDGTLGIWNRECERRLGWTAAELMALEENPIAVFYPDEAERAAVLADVERADGTFRQWEVMAKDGSRRIQQWANFALPNGSRISVGYDVTEQHAIEAHLRQAQKMQALHTLSGGIAHDFNNLLTIIGCSASLARRDVGADPSTAACLDEILLATERGADLVRRLMSFSRRDALRVRPLVLDDLLTGFVPTLRRLIPESLALEVSLDAPGAVVNGDPVAIEQIVMNLVSNARDAIGHHGRIQLRTTCANDADGPGVLLEVQDSGAGMSDETRERVFEPFFTTKEPGRGTGLGLPMVHGLVGQHGGTVTLRSALGEGTTVALRFPIHQGAERARAPRTDRAPQAPGRGETILLVEDDPAVAAAASEWLQHAGYVVLTATDGVAAMARLEENRDIALVLSDVVMPRMGGEELRRRMAESGHARTPIAFISGYPSDLHEAARLLPKPWKPEALTAFVRSCLDGTLADEGY